MKFSELVFEKHPYLSSIRCSKHPIDKRTTVSIIISSILGLETIDNYECAIIMDDWVIPESVEIGLSEKDVENYIHNVIKQNNIRQVLTVSNN